MHNNTTTFNVTTGSFTTTETLEVPTPVSTYDAMAEARAAYQDWEDALCTQCFELAAKVFAKYPRLAFALNNGLDPAFNSWDELEELDSKYEAALKAQHTAGDYAGTSGSLPIEYSAWLELKELLDDSKDAAIRYIYGEEDLTELQAVLADATVVSLRNYHFSLSVTMMRCCFADTDEGDEEMSDCINADWHELMSTPKDATVN